MSGLIVVSARRLFHRLRLFSLILVAVSSGNALAGGKDDPLLFSGAIDQFEFRDEIEHKRFALEGQAWLGTDLDKLSLEFDVEKASGTTEDLELQALYRRALLPYWDLHFGVRKDFQPTPSKSWLTLGIQGLAPYFFEVDAAVFVGEQGQWALRLKTEYELLLTQKLILTPELEVNFYGKNDVQTGVGSGLSDMEVGLRLRYEYRREFSPYVGVMWKRNFGRSAEFARSEGEKVKDFAVLVGLRFWF